MTFQDKLDAAASKNNSLLCVGLDPDTAKLPSHLKSSQKPLLAFNKEIVNATRDLVSCYKLNSAFFEAQGAEGIAQLKETVDYIKKSYPTLPVILDAKRADIDHASVAYASFAFDYVGADAVTVHPYLGREAVGPFLERADRGVFVLCRTSNTGAQEFQELSVDGTPLYQVVARDVADRWNKNNNCMLVAGATYPDELSDVRRIVGEMTLLVPGVGAQGGDLERVLKVGLNAKKQGLIITAARSIIFASEARDFAKAARWEARKLKGEINRLRV